MTIEWYNWCGYVGMLLVVAAFLLLQTHKLHGNGWLYQLMNLVGAIGMMLALAVGVFYLSVFLLALAWALIALYGMIFNRRRYRERVRGATDA